MVNVLNRENNINFMPNFPADNQLSKMTPISSGKVFNVYIFN